METRRSETAGGEFLHGTSDNPRFGRPPWGKEKRGWEAQSRELNPADSMEIKDLLEKIAKLLPRHSHEDEKKYDELKSDMAETIAKLSIGAEEMPDLFPEYFPIEDDSKLADDLREYEEEKLWEKEFEKQSSLEAGVKGATNEVASGRVVDTLGEVLKKVKIPASNPKHLKKLRMQKKAA